MAHARDENTKKESMVRLTDSKRHRQKSGAVVDLEGEPDPEQEENNCSEESLCFLWGFLLAQSGQRSHLGRKFGTKIWTSKP